LNANSAASKNGEILENIIINYNCQIINNKKHTFHRIYNDYTAQLDLIICSPLPASKLVDFEVLENKEMSSDHYPISAVFDLKPKKQDRVKSNQLKFDYKELFKEELDNSTLQTDTSIEELELNIRSKILDAAMKSVPTFNFKTSNSSLPNNIIELIKERRFIRNEIRKHKKKEDKTKYNKLKKIGFRKLRRTTDNLLFLTQKVKEQFNRKKKVSILFFDISKAFDKVWHAGLLYKLKLFIIDEKIPRIPPVYKLKTFNNKILTRSFYEQEIQ
jgi:hypothetical protein